MSKIDYNSMTKGDFGEKSFDKKWWTLEGDELANSVQKITKTLIGYDSARLTQCQISSKLYNNISLMGLNGLSFTRPSNNMTGQKDRVTYNIVQSGIDTIVAKMSKNKPKPMFLTSGGDYKIQRKAKKLDKYVEGVFYENKAHQLGMDALLHAAVLGDGFIQVYHQNGRIKYETTLAHELFVDQLEAISGKPRQLHRIKPVDRDVLSDMFPKYKDKIMDSKSVYDDYFGVYQTVADQVLVTESWRLPSGKDTGDGAHCITINGCTLFSEEYKKQKFPFARLQWSKRLNGFWGQSGAEQIQNIQLEINKILWIIQRSIHLAGSFKVFNKIGNKVVKEHLNNDIGAIIEYTDTAPQYVVPPIVPMELYSQLENLKKSAYEKLGVSQLSAASQKPAGLNSGAALREYNDIESERFTVLGKHYEDFFLELSDLTIDCAKELYEQGENLEVKIPDSKFVKSIKWKEVNMDEDSYIMKTYPVSSFPNDPSGRLQTVTEYMQAGMLTPRAGRRLLDFPDLEQVETLANSQENYIHELFERIIDDGEFTPPEPYDDLKLAREMALEYYAQGRVNGLEDDKLEMIRQFMSQIDILEEKAAAALAPQPTQPQSVPANPMPAPTSELMPMA
jgi:hypothetical protein